MKAVRQLSHFVWLFVLFICVQPALSAAAKGVDSNQLPKIIIVLDDVGYKQSDIAAFDLPVEVAFSILPQTPFAKNYAQLANAQGRDVMLHLPMASLANKSLGPAGLTVGMVEHDIEKTLFQALASVPHAIGVNNHMGSALTEQYRPMRTLMTALKSRSLFFLDSRTSPHSIAYETARDMGLPTDKRHVFLDHEQNEAFYSMQFERLVKIAKKYGRAIGIAHPYPSSLAFLSERLDRVEQRGVSLQPISTYFANRYPAKSPSYAAGAIVAAPLDE